MHLAGVTEIAELFGVTRQRASQIVNDPKFPKRLDDPPLAMGPVWKWATIERWKAKHR